MSITKQELIPFAKLREKIAGRYKRKKDFASAIGMSSTALSQRLNGTRQWKHDEIVAVCKTLDIPLEEAHLYFFTEIVATLQQ